MRTYRVPHTDLEVSCIGYGCLKLGGSWDRAPLRSAERSRAAHIIATAIDQGITLFDHADIYTYGKSEAVFGEVLQQLSGIRDEIVMQSKCGIRFQDDPQPGDPVLYLYTADHSSDAQTRSKAPMAPPSAGAWR